MKLTPRDKRLLKMSINHWNNDIIRHFQNGDNVIYISGYKVWENIASVVEDTVDFCPLCIKFYDSDCENCPYSNFYHLECYNDKGHWGKWYREPTLKNAIAMRNALQKILGGVK